MPRLLRTLLGLLLVAGCDDASSLDAIDGGGGVDATSVVDGAAIDGAVGSVDGGEACDPTTVAPPPDCPDEGFVPDSPTEPWRHTSTELFVITQGSPRHRCIDVILNPGQDQILIGKFTYGIFDKDLKDENVEIWIRHAVQSACAWERFGTFLTSEDGEYGTQFGIEDDGGRAFFVVPEPARLGLGVYPVRMLVKGDHSQASCGLYIWPRGTHAVVSDIDGTITTQETDGLWSVFDPTSPAPHPSAPEAFHTYVDKNYRLVFLTARPEFLTLGTRAWFQTHGFPFGAFHLSQGNFGELGDAARAYKLAYLETLAADQGVIFDWAYGNTVTDLQAYLSAGIAPSHIYLFEGEYDGDLMGSNRFNSYAAEQQRASCLAPVIQP